jgi:hypothetical protein
LPDARVADRVPVTRALRYLVVSILRSSEEN